jgi:Ca2+-transporting ATPase
MAFVTFVFFQAFKLLNVRDDRRSVFSRASLDNHTTFVATGAVVVLLVLTVQLDALHGFFTTTDLTSAQWLICFATGSVVLWAGELLKIGLRVRDRRSRGPR